MEKHIEHQHFFKKFKNLARAIDRLRSFNRRLNQFPFDTNVLSFKQLQCISEIADWYAEHPVGEDLSLKKLAERLDITTATASTMVDKLVTNNILQRQASKEDRRLIVITFTEQGAENVKHVRAKMEDLLGDMVQEMPEDLLRSVDELGKFIDGYIDRRSRV